MYSDSALLRRARGAPAADNAGPAPRILPLAAALIPRPPLFCSKWEITTTYGIIPPRGVSRK